MSIKSKILRVAERVLLFSGVVLLAIFSFAYLHRFVMFGAEMTRFETIRGGSNNNQAKVMRDPSNVGDLRQIRNIDSLSSADRTKSYQSESVKSADTLVLRIPRLHLEVPVLEGTDEFTLNRGLGRIPGTSRPGEGGNIGIAGHRDGFFRSLKDINTGDLIELTTAFGTEVYTVDRVRITRPADVSVLKPKMKPSLTLVTCYPFYFVGPAPKRYIVEASLKE
jgi:sortase A